MSDWYVGTTMWSSITIWAADTMYNVGDIRRQTANLGTLTVGNERAFRCTIAGTSGASEPAWVLTKAGTTNDNTVVWTEVTGNSAYGWSAAHARLANALSWCGAGDTIYVSNNNAETQASGLTLSSPGTAGSSVLIVCVNDGAAPPTTLGTTATISTTGANNISFSAGFDNYYGITFSAGSSSSTASILFANTTVSNEHYFDSCKLVLNNTSSSSIISVGQGVGGGTIYSRKVGFTNTKVKFGSTSQKIYFQPVGFFEWKNTPAAIDAAGSIPTLLLDYVTSNSAFITAISGVDFSALGSGKSLIDLGGGIGRTCINNCKLGDSVSTVYNSIMTPAYGRLEIDNCSAGDPSNGPSLEVYSYYGSVKTDTGVYRSGGASDGTPFSMKMVSNASGVSFISPLISRPIHRVAGTAGSAITATVEIIQADGATALTESECWLEVEYMGTSGSVLSSFLSDHNSTIIALSTTNQTTSSETWTGLTGSPVKQKLSVTFTPEEIGVYQLRVHLAKASATVYFDPQVVVS